MVATDWQNHEHAGFRFRGARGHGPGLSRTQDGTTLPENMKGLALRGPTRIINGLLAEPGIDPAGMPLPAATLWPVRVIDAM